MLIHKISLPFYPIHGWKHRMIFCGDFHFGAVNCDETLIARFVKEYASPSGDGCAPDGIPTSIFFLGDEIDAINCQDVFRFDPRSLHPRYHGDPAFLTTIADDFMKIMKPLRGQIIGGVSSNHISHIVKSANVDLMHSVRRELGMQYLGNTAYVVIQWRYYGRADGGSSSTVIWLSHSIPGGAYASMGRKRSLEKVATSLVNADIVVSGHSHELSADNPRTIETLGRDYKKVYLRFQHIIRSGNFLLSRWYDPSGWAPYGEKSGDPAGRPPGWAIAEISFPLGSRGKKPIVQCSVRRFAIEAGEGGTRAIVR